MDFGPVSAPAVYLATFLAMPGVPSFALHRVKMSVDIQQSQLQPTALSQRLLLHKRRPVDFKLSTEWRWWKQQWYSHEFRCIQRTFLVSKSTFFRLRRHTTTVEACFRNTKHMHSLSRDLPEISLESMVPCKITVLLTRHVVNITHNTRRRSHAQNECWHMCCLK